MAGKVHHETRRYVDSARRCIRSWCRCLRRRRGISCPLAHRTASARNADGHSADRNDTCGLGFGAYDRSGTLVASGGRAATPEDEQGFRHCSDPTSRLPRWPLWHTRFVAAVVSWLESARPVPGCSRSMNSSSVRAGSTTRERNASRTRPGWVSLPVRPPNESLSRRSTAALPLQGRAVCRWPRLRSKPLRSKPPLSENAFTRTTSAVEAR
jgi:hypothetical protein